MPSGNITELRQLLAQRFPGLRMPGEMERPLGWREWPTGLPQIDDPLGGGLPVGHLTEIVQGKPSAGSASLIRALIQQAGRRSQIISVIDGSDTLDVTSLDESSLARLLWVRCRSAEEALQAADLVLRDGNLSLVLLDLAVAAPVQLRKISPQVWYRFQRLVEGTATVCAIFTPWPMVSPAQTRLTLESSLALGMQEWGFDQVLRQIKATISDARQLQRVEGQSSA